MFKPSPKNLIRSVIFVIFLFLIATFIPPLRNPALTVLKAPLVFLSAVKNEISGLIFYHRNMVERQKLSMQVDNLNRKLHEAEETAQENTRLKNLLSLKQKSTFKVIAASVIARDPDSWSSIIIINKGRLHGLRKGLVVMSYLGLVGKIVEAGDSTSKVMLINDPNLGVSALISRTRQEGLVSGTLGSTLIMRYLPKDCDIQLQDKVVTSGLSSGYPKGLFIGTVIAVGNELSGLSSYAVIKPAVELSGLEEVLVIIP